MDITDLKVGDEVYSVSMGNGVISTIANDHLVINHGGKPWKYTRNLVRSGCNKTDLVRNKDQVFLNTSSLDRRKFAILEEIGHVINRHVD